MNRFRFRMFAAAAGVAAVLMVAAACSNGDSETPAAAEKPATNGTAPSGVAIAEEVGLAIDALREALPRVGQLASGSGSGTSGIWVTGEGSVALEPDLAVLNVGVESFASTVGKARGDAATAMDAINSALRDRGLQNRDIQTTSFNIRPQYEFQEIVRDGRRTGTQVLVGYTVTNQVRIMIRDLEAVGEIIDEVAEAGGDATRINGISFTVEDTDPLMDDLRKAAVEDAMDKARQFASLTGVALGKLVFITESGGGVPVSQPQAIRAFAESAVAPATSISGGELELNLRVQAVFAID